MKDLIITIVSYFLIFSLSAQNTRITGFVTDSISFEKLPYVNIFLQNSTQGTTTNMDGEFVFSFKATMDDTVCFSSMGYVVHKIAGNTLKNEDDLVIKLKPAILSIEEISVTENINDIFKKAIKQHVQKLKKSNLNIQLAIRHFVKNTSNDRYMQYKEILLDSKINKGNINSNRMYYNIRDYNCYGELPDKDQNVSEFNFKNLFDKAYNPDNYLDILRANKIKLNSVVYFNNKRCFLIEVPPKGGVNNFINEYCKSFNNKELQFFNYVWDKSKNYGQMLFYISIESLNVEKVQYFTIYPGFNYSYSIEYVHQYDAVYPKTVTYVNHYFENILTYSEMIILQLNENSDRMKKRSFSKLMDETNTKKNIRNKSTEHLFLKRDSIAKEAVKQLKNQ